jgi:hypothetical protein
MKLRRKLPVCLVAPLLVMAGGSQAPATGGLTVRLLTTGGSGGGGSRQADARYASEPVAASCWLQ